MTAATELPVVVALGANLGDPAETLRSAAREIREIPGLSITGTSPIYRTAPVGGPEQPDYLNAVMVGRWSGSPLELLHALQKIENAFGRTREIRWGPRTLDLDVIAVGDVLSDDAELTLPHPRAWERAFVLVPWLDADPDAVLVGQGPLRQRVEELDHSDFETIGAL